MNCFKYSDNAKVKVRGTLRNCLKYEFEKRVKNCKRYPKACRSVQHSLKLSIHKPEKKFISLNDI